MSGLPHCSPPAQESQLVQVLALGSSLRLGHGRSAGVTSRPCAGCLRTLDAPIQQPLVFGVSQHLPPQPPPPLMMGAHWSPTLNQPQRLAPSPCDLCACPRMRVCEHMCIVHARVHICARVCRAQKLMPDVSLHHSTLLRQGLSRNRELANPAGWPASFRPPRGTSHGSRLHTKLFTNGASSRPSPTTTFRGAILSTPQIME